MTPHDWITLVGILIGSGGGWRLLGKIERFLQKVDRIAGRVERVENAIADVARSHRQVVKEQARLVNRVNDHEAKLIQGGRYGPHGC